MNGLLRVPLFDDELLVSHLSRTARANGVAGSRRFCRDLGIDYRLLVRGEETETARVATALRQPPEVYLARRVVLHGSTRTAFAGEQFVGNLMARLPVGYCPRCLQSDRDDHRRMPGTRQYARVHWNLGCVRACDVHDVLLEPFTWSGSFYDMFDTCAQLENQSVAVVLRDARMCRRFSHFERFVVSRLSGRKIGGSLLDGLPLSQCIDLCHAFGAAAVKGRHFRLRKFSSETLHELAESGFLALSNGADGVDAILSDLARGASVGRTTGGNALYGSLYETLHRRPESYSGIKSLVNDLTLARFPHLQPLFQGLVRPDHGIPERIDFSDDSRDDIQENAA